MFYKVNILVLIYLALQTVKPGNETFNTVGKDCVAGLVFFWKYFIQERFMHTNLSAILFSAAAVFLAEMGDKTQLLAMAFSVKYKIYKVMLGVFLATVLNHGLAVVFGNLITRFGPLHIWVQITAAVSFIFFGLWTIKGDKPDSENNKRYKYGAVMTVFLAFFMAEMGDKTQLATIALAARFPEAPVGVLAGTTTGMLFADGIGIVAGVVFCKKIPDKIIKLVSAFVFILFGIAGSYQTMHDSLKLNFNTIILILSLILIASGFASFIMIKKYLNLNSYESINKVCKTDERKEPI